MPGGLVAALTAPLLELQATVGSGVFTADDPARMLRDVGSVLADVAATGTAATNGIARGWSGAGADAAGQAVSTVLAGAGDAASHASLMAGRVGAAADAVARAKTQLQRIIDDFSATARALESRLPESAGALTDAARRALAEAVGVVNELEAELDGHAAAVTTPPAATPAGSSATSPAAFTAPAMSGLGSAMPAMSGLSSGLLSAASPFADALTAPADAGQVSHEALVDPGSLGGGVAVHLPDGSTVMAPNTVAADAVRHALTQLGVPYHWGGTSPGVGLDCSGLTQWAYHEAGLDLPRLAQEQDIGRAVSQNALLPGDLAVWDGHVAMVVGDGQMIEAGDPVQLSPIRTTNAGQGFQGFWRPTG
ncbi:MAG TPA: C40 family peptidase [Mycobacterium sp.]|nr:C40 family peptidase [Mycobacterium sp.]